ncbi:hypothetical protein CEXT_728731 [Caerostris extrusa]|uniref:Uncharacterized protein n=1 Tax=Caerostris extrusa TaxID=172846 RepID=A0AAV4Y645_CAEEX|nr:hypothetical protein CEXT_728731 [Caerostris extrusa]
MKRPPDPFRTRTRKPIGCRTYDKRLKKKVFQKNLRAHSELLFRTHNGGNSEGLESDSRFLYVSYLYQTRVESRRTSVVTFVSRWQHF